MRRSPSIATAILLLGSAAWAQSPGQPPTEACRPGDFTIIGRSDEFVPKADGQFVVHIDRGFDGGFLTTDPIWLPSIESAIGRWNGIAGANWTFENRGFTDEFASPFDNELTISSCGVLFACPNGPPPTLPPGPEPPEFLPTTAGMTIIAVTLVFSDGGPHKAIGNSDIFFNPALPMQTNPGPDQIDFESVLVHELGHALGLDHNDNCVVGPTIMESLIDTGEIKRELFPSEIEGLRFLYPADDFPAVRVFDRDKHLRFDSVEGGPNPFSQAVSVFGPRGGRWIAEVTTSAGGAWAHLNPEIGNFHRDGTVDVTVDTAGLSSGDYAARIEVSIEGHPGPPVTIHVDLRVEAGPPAGEPPFLTQVGVRNGANLGSSALAPGALFTLFGSFLATTTAQVGAVPLPTRLGGAEVLVNTVPAPLLYVSKDQINGQIPTGVVIGPGGIVVRTGFGQTIPIPIRIDPAAPELFLTGDQQALILNQDGTVNSAANPVPQNSIISVFLTGQGAVSPPVESGRPAPVRPLSQVVSLPRAEIGGQEATVLFLGLAPGYVALSQGNIGVPSGASGRLSIRLRIGDIWGNVGFLYVE